ncbi:RNA dependent RNA polymerase-domain-containing protein [Immersiella caudata]|uniref:RNA-dependent RNA polymerase n=1 Tax=Immersiella caudata TaxID=314043 RepID=A0AA39WVC7_9PEZI|nr:RNA dependent RNA polymerase-domain-containing protein [Immersiella caudata]
MAVRPRLSAVSTGSTDYYSIEEIVISDDDDDDDNDEPVAIAPPRDSNVTPKPTQWAVAPPPPKPTTNTTKASFAAPPVPSTPSTRARTIPAKNIATPSRAPVTPSRPVATPAASARTPVTPSSRQIATPSAQTPVATIRKRLTGIWPSFPEWLHEAPMAVAWEMMRIGVHCKVDLSTLDGMQYNKEWATPRGIEKMWEDLRAYDKEHPLITNDDSLVALRFKTFPAKPADDIFAAALTDGFEFAGNTVVMVASLDYSPKSWGPLYLLDMKPLKFEKGCRLTRRFGPDRFLEVLIASPTGYGTAHAKIDGAAEAIIDWLTLKPHPLAGRKWRAFYTKSAGFRDPTKTDDTLLPASQMAKKIGTERVHLFAETGYGFKRAPSQDQDADFVVPVDETSASRTDFMASQMLDWLLDFKNNTDQPFLKLFSRISLGLTKTTPTVTFLPDHLVPEGESKQLLHQVEDILSPTGQVMNDGCGRMSLGTARLIRDYLGLQEIPSAVQGRIGSAKGMWIRDVDDPGQDLDNIWIETFPSQRKWVCDFEDPLQRTLEIKDVSRELSSANLNLQFLPVLEDRAVDKKKMRKTLGDRLRRELMRVFEAQDNAFSSPVHFKQWLAHFSTRKRRANIGYVPMLGGIPESKEELMHMMLDGGFVPKDSLYMVETALKLQQQLCEDLRTKMKISVGCSTYAYMCPDFTRTVPEGEAHLAFSNKFHAEDQDAFFTLLTKCDLLVARAPAHHPSDVQRVKAVFRHDLHCVQNVILFSIKGNVPLADKLSGGDYDGDLAWVCWDQEIVENFQNAEVPVQPDLSEHLVKDKRRFVDLIPAPADKETSKLDNVLFYSEPNTHGAARGPAALTTATYEMVNKSFQFAMLPDYLGICTNYKEKICYHRGNVNDEVALLLSTLVGQLVDAAKQGTKFTDATWKTLRTQLGPMQLPDPAYKTENRTFNVPVEQMHIIDYLKFIVAIPAIKSHLNALQIKLNPSASPRKGLSPSSLNEPKRTHYDADLTKLCNNFDDLGKTSSTFQNIHLRLKEALGELFEAWQRSARNPMSNDTSSSSANRVLRIYPQYQAITLQSLDCKTAPNIAFLLSGGPGTTTNSQPFLLSGESYLSDPSEYSQFALLKASTLFKHYYQRHPPYVWHMAGRQLCVLKALAVTNGGGSGYLTTVVPLMYAGMGTDQKFVRQYLARREVDSRRYIEGMEGEKEASVYDGY